jgi:Golgi phosphoprotein 3 (GPP34)
VLRTAGIRLSPIGAGLVFGARGWAVPEPHADGGVRPGRYVVRPAERYGQAMPEDSRLRGTGRVADDLWLMAHDDRTGRALLQPRLLGLGLAGGLLADLFLSGHAGLGPDGTIRTGPRARHFAVADAALLELIAAEPVALPVRDWLRYLATNAAGNVGARLKDAGYLTTVRRRARWLPGRLVPGDPDWAITPISRAGMALDPRRPVSPHASTLAGLAAACGLGFRLDQYLTRARTVPDAVLLLPPDLRALIACTQAAAASAVLSHRT